MGVDPVTHKPFAQVFAEYGKISGIPIQNARNHIQLSNNTTEKKGVFMESKQFPFSNGTPHDKFVNNIMNDQLQENYIWDSVETLQTHSFSEVPPLISSPTSCNPTVYSYPSFSSVKSQVPSSSSTCTWNEFILGDSFTSSSAEKRQGTLLSKDVSNSLQKENPTCGEVTEVEQVQPVEEDTCSSAMNSFVDTILARDKQILMDFPPLLDVYLDY